MNFDFRLKNNAWLNEISVLNCRLITMYFILPETEGRSLEDIELHYADNTKKISDIHICIKADYKNV